MMMMEAVVELTKLNIDQVFRIPATDFFCYIAYINERNRKREMEQRKILAQQRAQMGRH